uniref:Glutamyl-tRNA reductase n=1 Tax=Geoglobus ahangari TaxID=113653 RepID=A0A7C3UGW2_9EURY
MEISNLVVSHKKATIDELQKAWHGDLKSLIDRILAYPNITECVILHTCNRVEVYVCGYETVNTLKEFMKEMGVPKRIVEINTDEKALEHILRVASGLESMMVGEDQILGQVKEYYHLCKELGSVGDILDLVFKKAIQVGKKVRKLTNINKGAVSIGSAAVELAEKRLGSLKGKKVIIIGAGKMGRLVGKAIRTKSPEKVYVANRTAEKGFALAKEIGGIPIPFSDVKEYLQECDVVITATSAPHYIIKKDFVEEIMKKRDKPLLIIDIALPRDVEPEVGEINGVTLCTIDDLREISDENLRKRLNEAKKAEKIVKEEVKVLLKQIKELRAKKAVRQMYTLAQSVKEEEIKELFNKLKAKYGVGEDVLPLLDSFAESFIKKFLRMPTVRIKEAARNGNSSIIEVAEFLFGGAHNVPEGEDEKTEKRETAGPV